MIRPRSRAMPNESSRPRTGYNDDKSAQKRFEKRLATERACTTAARSALYRWSLLSPCSRAAVVLIGILLLIHIALGTLDALFHFYGLGQTRLAQPPNTASKLPFAVVINTYKRPDMLRDAVRHYGGTCGPKFGVSQVFVVWADQDATPPDPESFLAESALVRRGKEHLVERSSVHILRVRQNSLNSRFEPIRELTSDAIFMVDDDVRVSCATLHQGFMAWVATPTAMVGYYPRLAAQSDYDPAKFQYRTWRTVLWRQRVNVVLTKACFLHSKYLSVYSDPMQHPKEILDYVDEHMNCEDVAMSMLVANYTKATTGKTAFPVYVEGAVSDMGLFGGISTGGGHFSTRADCLQDLTTIYQRYGWGSPMTDSGSLPEHSWAHHSPGFWWQPRPSNFFEWLALG